MALHGSVIVDVFSIERVDLGVGNDHGVIRIGWIPRSTISRYFREYFNTRTLVRDEQNFSRAS